MQPVKAALQPVGAAVAAHQRQPEQDDQQCGKNHGGGAFARQNGVQPRVTPGLAAGDGLRGELPGIAYAIRGLLTVWQMRTDGHEAIQHVADRLPQAGDRIRVARARADDRDAKEGLQRACRSMRIRASGLIHQIDADDHARPALHQLDGKRQAPHQTGRVADGDQTGVRMRAQVVRGDMLLLRAGREGIGPRQVGDGITRGGVGVFPLRDRDGLARPVAGMLVQAVRALKSYFCRRSGFPASATRTGQLLPDGHARQPPRQPRGVLPPQGEDRAADRIGRRRPAFVPDTGTGSHSRQQSQFFQPHSLRRRQPDLPQRRRTAPRPQRIQSHPPHFHGHPLLFSGFYFRIYRKGCFVTKRCAGCFWFTGVLYFL